MSEEGLDHTSSDAGADYPASCRQAERLLGEGSTTRWPRGRREIRADVPSVDRYAATPGARTMMNARSSEWCEQILVEVVLSARSSRWEPEQFDLLVAADRPVGGAAAATCSTRRWKGVWPRSCRGTPVA